MKNMDDSRLKSEIDDIMKRVDSVLGKIIEVYPAGQEDEGAKAGRENMEN